MQPCYQWWEVPYYWAGLKAYDVVANFGNLAMSAYLTPSESLRRFPTLSGTRSDGATLKGTVRIEFLHDRPPCTASKVAPQRVRVGRAQGHMHYHSVHLQQVSWPCSGPHRTVYTFFCAVPSRSAAIRVEKTLDSFVMVQLCLSSDCERCYVPSPFVITGVSDILYLTGRTQLTAVGSYNADRVLRWAV